LTNGAPRIEINGELGEILALCKTSETTKPGRRRRALAEQIKVVAGERNHLGLLLTATGGV
jgi:hypothetical protein